jgi:hypothetical protein
MREDLTTSKLIERARKADWLDEKKRPVAVTVQPGLDKAAIDEIERELGVALPVDYRRLLELCSGIDGTPIDIDFTGKEHGIGFEEILPHSLGFANDGCGNCWCVDVLSTQEELSTIYYVSHDPPVVLYQCKGIDTFLEELLKMGQPGERSLVMEVSDDSLFEVWLKNPGLLSQDKALAADPELASFAKSFGPRSVVIDLRDPPVGMGFTWGRFGSNQETLRDGERRIFAYEVPEKKPGLFRRLFGQG